MFGWIARAYNWALGKVDTTVAGWVHDLVNGLYSFLHAIFGSVITAWDDFYTALKGAVHQTAEAISGIIGFIEFLWRHYLPTTLRWIRDHILHPLLSVLHWIFHEGAYMWHLLTHAADLARFIFDALIAQLEKDAERTAIVLGRWILKMLHNSAADFAHMVEDIIDAIF